MRWTRCILDFELNDGEGYVEGSLIERRHSVEVVYDGHPGRGLGAVLGDVRAVRCDPHVYYFRCRGTAVGGSDRARVVFVRASDAVY